MAPNLELLELETTRINCLCCLPPNLPFREKAMEALQDTGGYGHLIFLGKRVGGDGGEIVALTPEEVEGLIARPSLVRDAFIASLFKRFNIVAPIPEPNEFPAEWTLVQFSEAAFGYIHKPDDWHATLLEAHGVPIPGRVSAATALQSGNSTPLIMFEVAPGVLQIAPPGATLGQLLGMLLEGRLDEEPGA
jgi:hypothetical protein